MNIFYLDDDPIKAASYMHDKHIISGINESTQLLSNWAAQWDGPTGDEDGGDFDPFEQCSFLGDLPWTALSHQNVPVSKWLYEGLGNVQWLVNHLYGLLNEYDLRYSGNKDKFTKSRTIVYKMDAFLEHFKKKIFTPPVIAVPDKYNNGDAVESYRAYYAAEKAPDNRWSRPSKKPEWIVDAPKTVSASDIVI